MARYRDRFGVDAAKRAARVRSRPLALIVKEVLANSLDAQATEINLTCIRANGCRRDGAGLSGFQVTCVDNGCGCTEPDVLRRVGSSTSDLHPETRGRFGQGLIDLLAICERAEIRRCGSARTGGAIIQTLTVKLSKIVLGPGVPKAAVLAPAGEMH